LRFLAAVQLLPALESGEETLVGGQAVLEGVMMRTPHAWAIACRKPSGEVVTMSEPLERPSDKHKWMAWPVVRGVMTLGYAMNLGYRALRFSANVAIEDMMQEEQTKSAGSPARSLGAAAPETAATDPKTKNRENAASISGWLAAVNVILSLGFFITPALVGGPRDLMIAVLVEQQVEMFNWPFASALAVLLLAAALLVFAAFARSLGIEQIFARARR
jgi:hypothetical protein